LNEFRVHHWFLNSSGPPYFFVLSPAVLKTLPNSPESLFQQLSPSWTIELRIGALKAILKLNNGIESSSTRGRTH
jgi:hypothetical protein